MIRASGWPTLTWSPTATSSSTTPSTGARQRVLHLHRLDGDDDGRRPSPCSPSSTSTATTVPGMGLAQLGVAAVLVVGAHRRPPAPRRRTAVRPSAGQPDLAVGGGDDVVGAQPVERDARADRPSETSLSASGFRRPRPAAVARRGVPRQVHVVGALAGAQPDAWSARARRSASRRHVPRVGGRPPASCAATGTAAAAISSSSAASAAAKSGVRRSSRPVSSRPPRRRDRRAGSAGTRCWWSTPSTAVSASARSSARERRRPVGGVGDHLGEHRVVVAADRRCPRRVRESTRTPVARRLVERRAPSPPVGRKPRAGILGVDAGLDGVPGQRDVVLRRSEQLLPAAMRSCRSTRSRPVTSSVTGCSTCRRVFISMKKNSSGRSADDDELDGARAGVVDAARACRTAAAPIAGARRRVEQRRRRLLDDLLVPALQGALALAEVDDVAVRVGEHLHLDVAGASARTARGAACRRRRRAPASRAR